MSTEDPIWEDGNMAQPLVALRPVIVESPYGSDDPTILDRNIAYARHALHDCIMRGEAPFASHLLYTQPSVLDDSNPVERALGIEAGLAWGEFAELTAVYSDLGLTRGMNQGIARALAAGRRVEYRSLPDWV